MAAVDGIITEYSSSPLGPLDVAKYGFVIGNNKGQQVWEALAILVAIDLWSKQWNRDRIVLKVRGDNVTALVLLIKMRPKVTKTPGETHDAVKASKLAIVARELALRLVDLSFPPDGEHTPGIGHIFADMLSRVDAPAANKGMDGILLPDAHPSMATSTRVDTPPRDSKWYKV